MAPAFAHISRPASLVPILGGPDARLSATGQSLNMRRRYVASQSPRMYTSLARTLTLSLSAVTHLVDLVGVFPCSSQWLRAVSDNCMSILNEMTYFERVKTCSAILIRADRASLGGKASDSDTTALRA